MTGILNGKNRGVTKIGAIVAIFVAAIAIQCQAQPPGGGPGGPGGRGGPDGNADGRPPFLLLGALDADGDGTLSADEITGAEKALKGLDKDGDGKLSHDEFMHPRRRGGEGGHGGPRGERAGRGQRGGPNGAGAQRRRGGQAPEGGHASPEKMVERLMNFDEDANGETSKEEMPERIHGMFERADSDGNGSITKEEILKMAKNFQGRSGGSGEGGRRSGRPQRPPAE